jgi:hypothetical protein
MSRKGKPDLSLAYSSCADNSDSNKQKRKKQPWVGAAMNTQPTQLSRPCEWLVGHAMVTVNCQLNPSDKLRLLFGGRNPAGCDIWAIAMHFALARRAIAYMLHLLSEAIGL